MCDLICDNIHTIVDRGAFSIRSKVVSRDLSRLWRGFIVFQKVMRMTSATGPNHHFFYLVTVNYKSRDSLDLLIDSLKGECAPKKLIIVDHSGELSETTFDTDFPIQVISQENMGYGAGLNRGLKEIPESDALVLLCNPDVRILTPERIRDVTQYMNANPNVGAIAPRIITHEGYNVSSCRQFYTLLTVMAVRFGWIVRKRPTFIEKHYYWDKGFETPFVADWASGAALFCRLSAFPDRNFFDERFFLYMEDVDLSARLWENGRAIEYFPEFMVEHHEARKSRKNFRFLFMHVTSLLKFIWKYKGFPTRESLKLNKKSQSGFKPAALQSLDIS